MSVRLVIAEDEHMRRMLADIPDFNGSRRWPRQGAGRRLCSLGDRRGPYVRSSMKPFCTMLFTSEASSPERRLGVSQRRIR
jgi:hypothetical protein